MANRQIRVLLVEDDSDCAVLLQEMIAKAGQGEFETGWVRTLTEACRRIGQERFDAIVLDLMLPDSKGVKSVEKMRAQAPDLPILVVSSLDDDATVLETMQKGAQDYLIKGHFVGEMFGRAIRYAIGRGHAEQALRDNERKYRELANSLPGVVCEFVKDGNIVFANPNAFKMFGYGPEELGKGLNIIQMVCPADRDRVKRDILRVFDGQDIGGVEYTAVRKDGSTVPVIVYVNAIIEKDTPTGVRAVVIDISERKRLEDELRQSQKMDAIGRLAGGIAHDFNNLLMAIKGYADLSLQEEIIDTVRHYIEAIQKAADRAALLTSKLLTFTRKQPPQLRTLDLNAFVRDMMDMLRHLIGEDIELVADTDPDLASVRVDLGQMQQVLMNLAVNAKDAMPDGGKLTIKTENVTFDDSQSMGSIGAKAGTFVCVSVTDTGIGMDEKVVTRIFEPFFTMAKGQSGTGLGLSIVYGIVKQHEGWVDVQSELSKGSSFRIYVPAHLSEAVDHVPETVSNVDLHGHGERILLVEDEEPVRDVVTRVLQKNGYVVFETWSVARALEVFAREKQNFDLVLTDVVLPDKTGVELIDEIRSVCPDMPVLVMSGYTDEKAHREVIERIGLPFLQKPVSSEGLLSAIQETLTNEPRRR